jgi:hypothetical protein
MDELLSHATLMGLEHDGTVEGLLGALDGLLGRDYDRTVSLVDGSGDVPDVVAMDVDPVRGLVRHIVAVSPATPVARKATPGTLALNDAHAPAGRLGGRLSLFDAPMDPGDFRALHEDALRLAPGSALQVETDAVRRYKGTIAWDEAMWDDDYYALRYSLYHTLATLVASGRALRSDLALSALQFERMVAMDVRNPHADAYGVRPMTNAYAPMVYVSRDHGDDPSQPSRTTSYLFDLSPGDPGAYTGDRGPLALVGILGELMARSGSYGHVFRTLTAAESVVTTAPPTLQHYVKMVPSVDDSRVRAWYHVVIGRLIIEGSNSRLRALAHQQGALYLPTSAYHTLLGFIPEEEGTTDLSNALLLPPLDPETIWRVELLALRDNGPSLLESWRHAVTTPGILDPVVPIHPSIFLTQGRSREVVVAILLSIFLPLAVRFATPETLREIARHLLNAMPLERAEAWGEVFVLRTACVGRDGDRAAYRYVYWADDRGLLYNRRLYPTLGGGGSLEPIRPPMEPLEQSAESPVDLRVGEEEVLILDWKDKEKLMFQKIYFLLLQVAGSETGRFTAPASDLVETVHAWVPDSIHPQEVELRVGLLSMVRRFGEAPHIPETPAYADIAVAQLWHDLVDDLCADPEGLDGLLTTLTGMDCREYASTERFLPRSAPAREFIYTIYPEDTGFRSNRTWLFAPGDAYSSRLGEDLNYTEALPLETDVAPTVLPIFDPVDAPVLIGGATDENKDDKDKDDKDKDDKDKDDKDKTWLTPKMKRNLMIALGVAAAAGVAYYAYRTQYQGDPDQEPGYMDQLKEGFTSTANAVGRATTGAANAVGQTVGSAANAVGQTVGSAANAVGQTVGSAANAVGQTVNSAASGAAETLSNIRSSLFQSQSQPEGPEFGPHGPDAYKYRFEWGGEGLRGARNAKLEEAHEYVETVRNYYADPLQQAEDRAYEALKEWQKDENNEFLKNKWRVLSKQAAALANVMNHQASVATKDVGRMSLWQMAKVVAGTSTGYIKPLMTFLGNAGAAIAQSEHAPAAAAVVAASVTAAASALAKRRKVMTMEDMEAAREQINTVLDSIIKTRLPPLTPLSETHLRFLKQTLGVHLESDDYVTMGMIREVMVQVSCRAALIKGTHIVHDVLLFPAEAAIRAIDGNLPFHRYHTAASALVMANANLSMAKLSSFPRFFRALYRYVHKKRGQEVTLTFEQAFAFETTYYNIVRYYLYKDEGLYGVRLLGAEVKRTFAAMEPLKEVINPPFVWKWDPEQKVQRDFWLELPDRLHEKWFPEDKPGDYNRFKTYTRRVEFHAVKQLVKLIIGMVKVVRDEEKPMTSEQIVRAAVGSATLTEPGMRLLLRNWMDLLSKKGDVEWELVRHFIDASHRAFAINAAYTYLEGHSLYVDLEDMSDLLNSALQNYLADMMDEKGKTEVDEYMKELKEAKKRAKDSLKVNYTNIPVKIFKGVSLEDAVEAEMVQIRERRKLLKAKEVIKDYVDTALENLDRLAAEGNAPSAPGIPDAGDAGAGDAGAGDAGADDDMPVWDQAELVREGVDSSMSLRDLNPLIGELPTVVRDRVRRATARVDGNMHRIIMYIKGLGFRSMRDVRSFRTQLASIPDYQDVVVHLDRYIEARTEEQAARLEHVAEVEESLRDQGIDPRALADHVRQHAWAFDQVYREAFRRLMDVLEPVPELFHIPRIALKILELDNDYPEAIRGAVVRGMALDDSVQTAFLSILMDDSRTPSERGALILQELEGVLPKHKRELLVERIQGNIHKDSAAEVSRQLLAILEPDLPSHVVDQIRAVLRHTEERLRDLSERLNVDHLLTKQDIYDIIRSVGYGAPNALEGLMGRYHPEYLEALQGRVRSRRVDTRECLTRAGVDPDLADALADINFNIPKDRLAVRLFHRIVYYLAHGRVPQGSKSYAMEGGSRPPTEEELTLIAQKIVDRILQHVPDTASAPSSSISEFTHGLARAGPEDFTPPERWSPGVDVSRFMSATLPTDLSQVSHYAALGASQSLTPETLHGPGTRLLRYAIDRILSTTEITPEVHDLFRGAQIVAVKLALEEKPGHEEAHRAFHAMYPNRFLLRVVDPDAVYERIPPSIYIQ